MAGQGKEHLIFGKLSDVPMSHETAKMLIKEQIYMNGNFPSVGNCVPSKALLKFLCAAKLDTWLSYGRVVYNTYRSTSSPRLMIIHHCTLVIFSFQAQSSRLLRPSAQAPLRLSALPLNRSVFHALSNPHRQHTGNISTAHLQRTTLM